VSADARPQGPAARGRLRIYLGYAPGGGTTCAMLSEGHGRAEHGADVVVATADTHGRPYTGNLLAGLEVIPAAKVPYRGTLAEEMDLGAVLARGPAVALVDDVAHRNAPGSRHRGRWQDVEDLLAAGIDVISTVRVGHLDSVADVVAKITGAAPRQSVPDPVVRAAGEVELVDVAPDVLRDRLARGHIYPAGQVEAALGGWFQTGNLSALRELALLWLAAALAGGPRRHLPGGGDPGSGQARERVVVALSGGPEGEMLIRRAARIVARSGGDLLAVHAAPAGLPAGSGRAVLAAQRRLAESAGGTYHQVADQDIPAALLAFAHAHNATQLVLGATPRTGLAALRPAASITSRVIRRGAGLDVHIVTCTPTANGVPAAACEPHQRKRTVMRQQNTCWPGRMRQAACWGRGGRLGGHREELLLTRGGPSMGNTHFAGTDMLRAGTGSAQAAWHGGAAGQAEGMS
jgi:two-component system, OmpR family, sensor histidine kinase KdpD